MSFTPSESKREITHRLTSSLVVLDHLQLFLDACQSKPRSSCHLLLRNPLPCQTRPLVTGLLERTRLSEFHALRFLPGKRRHEVRGRLSGTVPVEGSALDCDSPAARCGKDNRRSSAEGTPLPMAHPTLRYFPHAERSEDVGRSGVGVVLASAPIIQRVLAPLRARGLFWQACQGRSMVLPARFCSCRP